MFQSVLSVRYMDKTFKVLISFYLYILFYIFILYYFIISIYFILSINFCNEQKIFNPFCFEISKSKRCVLTILGSSKVLACLEQKKMGCMVSTTSESSYNNMIPLFYSIFKYQDFKCLKN